MATERLTPLFDTKSWSRKTWLTVEVCVLCSLHVGSVYIRLATDPRTLSPSYSVTNEPLYWILISLSLCAVYLFVIWATGDPLANFGIWPLRFGAMGLLCVALTIGAWFVAQMVAHQVPRVPMIPNDELYQSYLHWKAGQTKSLPQSPITLTIIALVPTTIASRGFYQAYLITRLTELTKSTGHAVMISAVFFSLVSGSTVHGNVVYFIEGLAYGGIFLLGRSLWPVVVGSFIFHVYFALQAQPGSQLPDLMALLAMHRATLYG